MGNVLQPLLSSSAEKNHPTDENSVSNDVPSMDATDEENFIVSEQLSLYSRQIEELTWIPKLLQQKALVHLKICNVGEIEGNDDSQPNPLSFASLSVLFEVNKATLTSVELIQFQIIGNVDIQVFQQLTQLKVLELHKHADRKLSKILNVTSLPESLEKLVIKCLSCDYNQLNRLARASHLKNLKHLELAYVSYPSIYLIFPQDIIQIFLKNKSVDFWGFTPVRISRFWTEDSGKDYFDVGKGYLLPLSQKFPYREGIAMSNLTINSKDIKKKTEQEDDGESILTEN